MHKFVSDFMHEKIIILGDMNAHIGILSERQNNNGDFLREACENMLFAILNETLAKGRVTWNGREQTSAIDYGLANESARENISTMHFITRVSRFFDNNFVTLSWIANRFQHNVFYIPT